VLATAARTARPPLPNFTFADSNFAIAASTAGWLLPDTRAFSTPIAWSNCAFTPANWANARADWPLA
jgi:hypothetical protein